MIKRHIPSQYDLGSVDMQALIRANCPSILSDPAVNFGLAGRYVFIHPDPTTQELQNLKVAFLASVETVNDI